MPEPLSAEGAPAPEAPPTAPPAPAAAPAALPDQTAPDASGALKSDLAKERKARQALEKQIEEFRTAQMSEQERAVAEAVARARTDALHEVGTRLATAEIRSALIGVLPKPQVDALLEDINPAKYLTENGEVDDEKVAALVQRQSQFAPKSSSPPSAPVGASSTPDPGEMSMEDFRRMRAEQRGR